ncbi:MAG TPA: MBL fold metallo-hydrolase [Smithella sp.]|nr:MBL fold metallo-hydrolase [Smithella sp.]
MTEKTLRIADKIEILTLQDNYIDMLAADGNEIISRSFPLINGEIGASVLAEHGFSTLIKIITGGETHTLLFDFGFSENGAAQNAKTLGIDLTEVEVAVLSHGHIDHTGGLMSLGAMIGKINIPFMAHPSVFKSPRYLKFAGDFKINFPKFTRDMVQLAGFSIIESEKPAMIMDDTVLFLGEIPRRSDFEKGMPNTYWLKDGHELPDMIEDDTSVIMNLRNKGLLIISGCAHSGIINTMRYALEVTGIERIHAVMGGFHLTGHTPASTIERTIKEMRNLYPAYVIPAHCTGHRAIAAIEGQMPEQFLLNMAGTKLTFA